MGSRGKQLAQRRQSVATAGSPWELFVLAWARCSAVTFCCSGPRELCEVDWEQDRTVSRTLRKNNIEIEKQLQVVETPHPALRATLSRGETN